MQNETNMQINVIVKLYTRESLQKSQINRGGKALIVASLRLTALAEGVNPIGNLQSVRFATNSF